jgi:signal transduction histidine kinase
MEPLLRVINLSKRFDTLPAIQNISFDIHPGEVIGLAGNIGSGKSVLVMLLSGFYEASEGSIYFANERLAWPFNVNRLGIGVIHQRPDLADQMDVVSNIFLGNEIGWPASLGWLRFPDRRRMDQEASEILSGLGVSVPSLREKVGSLSSEQRQMIAIARVLTHPVRFVIIDEPTASLTYPYQQKLLDLIQVWRKEGTAVLFSSNNLDYLFAVTDRIITLYQGHKIADVRTDETNRDTIVANLLGSGDRERVSATILDFDSHDRIREQAERLHYHQMLLEKDLAAQDTLNRQLVERLTEHVQALDRLNLALQEAHRRLISEREQERKHLARELHDQVIQDLLGINYQLESAEAEHQIPSGLVGELVNAREGILTLVDDLRRICGDLRPPTIDSLGVGAALKSFARDWSERTNIEVVLDIDQNLGRLPEATELSIFRVIQEGLNNVWRHAKASRVWIKLVHTSPRMLLISIADNGLGIKEELDIENLPEKGNFGLLGISERVVLLGGRMRVTSQPEGGTELRVEIPHPRVKINANVK